jgi:uncharacterized membrane protein YbhN (UPF0104 family)
MPDHAHTTALARQLGRKRRLGLLIAVGGVLAFGASVGVASVAGWQRTWQVLVYPQWIWLPVAFGAEVVAYVGYTFAYREVVRAEGGHELGISKAAALVATGFGVFVQAGGFALDRLALQRAGLSANEARARVLGLGALEYVVLAPATAVAALIIVLGHTRISEAFTLPWVIAVPAGFAFALLALRLKERFRLRRHGWHGHLRDALVALDLTVSLTRRPLEYGLALIGIGLYWAGDILCLWCTLHAFSAGTPTVPQLIVGYATGYALTRRTLPLGGAGPVDALLPFALGWVGIALAPALLAVVAYRLINLWLPLLPALGSLPTLRRLAHQA